MASGQQLLRSPSPYRALPRPDQPLQSAQMRTLGAYKAAHCDWRLQQTATATEQMMLRRTHHQSSGNPKMSKGPSRKSLQSQAFHSVQQRRRFGFLCTAKETVGMFKISPKLDAGEPSEENVFLFKYKKSTNNMNSFSPHNVENKQNQGAPFGHQLLCVCLA